MLKVSEAITWLEKQPKDAFLAVPFGDYVDNRQEELLIVQYGPMKDPSRMLVLDKKDIKEKA